MAILKRRHPKKNRHKIRDALWPRMGWRRTLRYTGYRLIRIQDSERNIAVGLSWGAAVSFNPFLGTHILQAILFSWLTRGNVIAGVVGTAWGNPWTLPFMQLAGFELGKLVFGLFGIVEFADMPEHLTIREAFEYAVEHPYDLVMPWIVGGVTLTAVSWPLFYILHLGLLESARKAHHTAREDARQRRALRDERKEMP